MFKHILVPTDGSDLSRKAILYGVQLAKESGGKVTGLTVAEPYRIATMDTVLIPVDEGDYEEQSRLLSEKATAQVRMAADAAGVPCETIREVHDQPYRASSTLRTRLAAISSSWPRTGGAESRPCCSAAKR